MNKIAEMLKSALKKVETLVEKLIPGAVTVFHTFFLSGAKAKAKKHQTRTTKVATWACEEISSRELNRKIISIT
jgi:predicted O-methyltransferase YrrM